jgi:RNA polymerase sigma-54 factor
VQQTLSLSQRMELKLQMTTQMIQSIQLLQLPLLALQEKVEQELEDNPALEVDEPEEDIEVDASADPKLDDTAERAFEEELDDLRQDWHDSLGTKYRPPEDGEDPKYKAMQNTAAPETTLREHLFEQLQMLEKVTPRERAMAELIILNLDSSGFLTVPLLDVFQVGHELIAETALLSEEGDDSDSLDLDDDSIMIGMEEVLAVRDQTQQASDLNSSMGQAEVGPENLPEATADLSAPANDLEQTPQREALIDPLPDAEEAQGVLLLVQSLDPSGVGARDTRECLLLQLQRSPGNTSFEECIIENYFDDLIHNRLPKIARAMDTDVEEIKGAIEIIAMMNPRPGARFGGQPVHYIRPDVVVREIDGRYEVMLNDWGLPKLRISPAYLEMLKERSSKDKSVREYIQEKMQSARWLIDAIGQRKNTLLRISREVVDIQQQFVARGVNYLKPLPMQEVADRLGLHVSTISRAMTDKHVQLSHGVYPLRSFVVGGYQTADGDSESAPAVMERIKTMVEKEDGSRPLTDMEIVKELKLAGLKVARRTVAKYRDRLGIAGSRQRKKY